MGELTEIQQKLKDGWCWYKAQGEWCQTGNIDCAFHHVFVDPKHADHLNIQTICEWHWKKACGENASEGLWFKPSDTYSITYCWNRMGSIIPSWLEHHEYEYFDSDPNVDCNQTFVGDITELPVVRVRHYRRWAGGNPASDVKPFWQYAAPYEADWEDFEANGWERIRVVEDE